MLKPRTPLRLSRTARSRDRFSRGRTLAKACPQRVARAIVAIAGLLLLVLTLSAVPGAGRRDDHAYAPAVPNVTVIYVGADDCPPCRAWARDQWPQFRGSSEFGRLNYRAVESSKLKDVLDDENWPSDLRAYRRHIEPGSGVPLWLVLSQGELVLRAYGSSQWNATVVPAVRQLLLR
jgi:hypothetical protein